MLSPPPDSSISTKTTGSFLVEWSHSKLPIYIEEYGGERAGVPKGEDIPFPSHKVQAALALLAYGAPNHETLTKIARTVRVSSALLRVWRTEERFLALYRRAVWECANDYTQLLSVNWNDQRLAPYHEFQRFFGVALRQAILSHLCVDVLHMVPEWMPFGLEPKWRSEYTLVGASPKIPAVFSKDETALLKSNTHILLLYSPSRIGSREPDLAQWASSMVWRHWTICNIVDTDLRAAVETGSKKVALGLIDFVTVHSPLDDMKTLHRLVHRAKARKRRQ